MASLGSLVIEMAANTARLQSDLGKAVSMAEGTASRIKDAFGKLTGGLLAGGLTAGLVAMVAHSVELGDELAKGAARAGVTGGQFAEMAAAAKQADVDIGTLSKGLKNVGEVVSSAFGGDKGAQDSIHALGLSFEQLHGENATQQLMDVADALSGIQNPSDRARLGTALLGKAYLEMVPLLDGGSAAIQENIDAQKRLGNVMSTEMVANFSAADDNIKQLKGAWTGFTNYLAEKALPTISLVTEAYKQLSGSGSEIEKINASITAKQIARDGILQFNSQATTDRLTGEIAALEARKHGIEAQALVDEIDASNRRAAIIAQAAVESKASADAAERERAAQADIAQYKKDAAAFDPNKMFSQNMSAAADFQKQFADTSQDYTDRMIAMNVATQSSLDQQTAAWLTYKNNIRELVSAGTAFGGLTEEQGGQRLQDYWQTHMVEPMKKASDDMSEYAKQAAHSIQNAFAQFLFDPFKDGLKGLLTGFIDAIRQMVANAAAAKLSEALLGKDGSSGWLGSLLGAVVGGATSSTAANSAIADQFAPRAGGGPVSAGSTYLVGEKGPELFSPGASGAIYPNMALAGAGGGSAPININTHIDARGATTDLVAALPGILKRNNEALHAKILDGIRRKRTPI